jgi:hypothetical protein
LIEGSDGYDEYDDRSRSRGDIEAGHSVSEENYDACCADGSHRSRCRITAIVLLFIVLPVLYVSILAKEYRTHGWDRFRERAYPRPIHNVTVEISGTEVVTHPFRIGWLLPLTGFVTGLFTNIAPVQAGIVLAPLFQKHAVTTSSEGTLALIAAFHFIGNGLCGGLSWSTFEPKLFACKYVHKQIHIHIRHHYNPPPLLLLLLCFYELPSVAPTLYAVHYVFPNLVHLISPKINKYANINT